MEIKKRMTETVLKYPALRGAYVERHQPIVDGRQVNLRNVLVGYRLKLEEVSDDDDDDEN